MSWPSFDLVNFKVDGAKYLRNQQFTDALEFVVCTYCCVRFTVCSLHLTTLKFVLFFFYGLFSLVRLMARELVDNNVTGRVSQGLLYIEYFIFPQTFKMFDGSEFWQKQKNSLKTETVYQPFLCYDHEIVIFSLRASKM